MGRAAKTILICAVLLIAVALSAAAEVTVNFTKKDLDPGFHTAGPAVINLSPDGITVSGSGVETVGSTVRILAAGTYIIQGKLEDGQLVVEAGANDDVQLVLNGVRIASASTAPIYVSSADKVILTLAPGTINTITDGTSPTSDSAADDINAVIFSRDDLTINGAGTLIVNGNYRHGIVSKDDLKIVSGTIEITAVGDGLKGRDLVAVRGGQITITAGQDGIQSNNDTDPSRGFVYIENGRIDITAELDGIQAETDLLIKGGTVTIKSGGGSAVSSNLSSWGMWGRGMPAPAASSPSAKGLKAGVGIIIDGGSITIDSSDDAVHANGQITINGGLISISSGDDAIHADSSITINGGEIAVARCYEGLESTFITINDGMIRIADARDDGINAAGGVDASATAARPGRNPFMSEAYGALTINGGWVVISAEGDGIDSNGDITMTGGTVIVHGPASGFNSALDYNREFIIEGGILVAAGSAGMAMAPSANSSQKSIVVTFNAYPADELVHIATSDNNEPIITFKSSKTFQSLVVSTPQVQTDTNYVIYRGGTHTGTEQDGLFTDGTYTPGTQISTVSANQSQSQGWPGFPGMPMPPGPWGRRF